MKKIMILAAATLLAVSAQASKARKASLQNAAHVQDINDQFVNPDRILNFGDWVTFEFGGTGGGLNSGAGGAVGMLTALGDADGLVSNRAEGGFVRRHGDAAYGLYLGYMSLNANGTRAFSDVMYGGTAASNKFLTTENPIYFTYAMKASDLQYGVGFLYSKSDKKTTFQKQEAMGLTFSAEALNVWDARFVLGLSNTASFQTSATSVEQKITGKPSFELGGGYHIDTMYLYGSYKQVGIKGDNGAGTDVVNFDTTIITVGATESMKVEGGNWFYGAGVQQQNLKNAVASELKVTQMVMPVIVGLEVDAASWATVRGSVTQNILLGSRKVESGGTGDADTITDNTTVAAGVGIKAGKFAIDGTLSTATDASGEFNTSKMLANTSLTYNF